MFNGVIKLEVTKEQVRDAVEWVQVCRLQSWHQYRYVIAQKLYILPVFQ